MAMGPLRATAQGITFDEFGRPFIILKEQESQRRLTGLEAQKVSCSCQTLDYSNFTDFERLICVKHTLDFCFSHT
jgi:hypothetical protein